VFGARQLVLGMTVSVFALAAGLAFGRLVAGGGGTTPVAPSKATPGDPSRPSASLSATPSRHHTPQPINAKRPGRGDAKQPIAVGRLFHHRAGQSIQEDIPRDCENTRLDVRGGGAGGAGP
jgi:hypothetical protein